MPKLVEIKPEVNETLVKMLSEALELAKEGKMQSACIGMVFDDCATGNAFSGGWMPVSLVGELRVMERDLIDLNIDTRRKPMWEFCE